MEPSVSILFAVMTVLSPMLTKAGFDEASDIDRQQLYCAAQNVYFESRGEPDLGQMAVTQVVLNRMESSRWPDSCLLYTSPSPRDATLSRMPSSA